MKRYVTGFAVACAVALVLALTACGSGSVSDTVETLASQAYSAGTCRVIVLDESGAPVEGVSIQLCSDSLCFAEETDGEGVAAFKDIDDGAYTVHVLTVPERYAQDETEYPVSDGRDDVTITLKAGA